MSPVPKIEPTVDFEQLERDLQSLAQTDPSRARRLRRAFFVDTLAPVGNKRAYQLFEKRHRDTGVHVHVDLNNLHELNKIHGDEAGDYAISTFGHTASKIGRQLGGKSFRFGGDEFKHHFNNLDDAKRFVSQLHQAVSKTNLGLPNFKLSFSAGVGPNRDHAEGALMEAKKQKKAANMSPGQAGNHIAFHPTFNKSEENLTKEMWDPGVPWRAEAIRQIHGWIAPNGKFHHMDDNELHDEFVSELLGGDELDAAYKSGEVEDIDDVGDWARNKGWISVGHTGQLNASGHTKVLNDPNHPATRTLGQMMSKLHPGLKAEPLTIELSNPDAVFPERYEVPHHRSSRGIFKKPTTTQMFRSEDLDKIITPAEATKIRAWADNGYYPRDKIHETMMHPRHADDRKAMTSALRNETRTKMINGERHFLLHRGTNSTDPTHSEDTGTVTYHQPVSTTPDRKLARGFAEETPFHHRSKGLPEGDPTIHSVWVPESAISLVLHHAGQVLHPHAIEKLPPDIGFTRGSMASGGEREVLIAPGQYTRANKMFRSEDLGKTEAPDSLDTLNRLRTNLHRTKEYLGRAKQNFEGAPFEQKERAKDQLARALVSHAETENYFNQGVNAISKKIPPKLPGQEYKFKDQRDLETHLHTQPFAVLSAHRTTRTPEQNEQHHNALLQDLKRQGIAYTTLKGKWGGSEEPSFMLHGVAPGVAAALAKKYDQIAHLHSDKGFHAETSHKPEEYTPMQGHHGHVVDPYLSDNYSEVPFEEGGQSRFRLNLEPQDKAPPSGPPGHPLSHPWIEE